jgi:hypothetical protein
MRNVRPQLAGAASGVMNTTRQIGSVIAIASVGALLQNRLASSFVDQAQQQADQLPAQARAPFLSGFANAASNGLQLGAGQSGGQVRLPSDASAGLVGQVERAARGVFTHGFVHAMHITLVLPIVVLLLGSAICLLLTRRDRTSGALAASVRTPAAPARPAAR